MVRTMGVSVLVTICTTEHRYKNMAEIFKGLCRSGAWWCFDEFNRIQLEVLLVLATIISAKIVVKRIKKDLNSLNVLSTDIELILTMGYFITINPSYSGRQELPENLKIFCLYYLCEIMFLWYWKSWWYIKRIQKIIWIMWSSIIKTTTLWFWFKKYFICS